MTIGLRSAEKLFWNVSHTSHVYVNCEPIFTQTAFTEIAKRNFCNLLVWEILSLL